MNFNVKRVVLIAVAALLAVALVVLVVIALSGLGNIGDQLTQPTTAPTEPTQPPEDHVIETPYGNICFPGQYAPYLEVEKTETPELTMKFIASMDSGKTHPLFDLRFGQPVEPAIGQVVTGDGIAVGVYLTKYQAGYDGTWPVKETELVSEMLALVDGLVAQLDMVALDAPIPEIQDGEIVIETPYCKLYFPERWKEELRIDVDQSKGYELLFIGNFGEHKGVKLFALNFGGGPEAGQIAHTLRTENDVQLHIYLRSFALEMDDWTALDADTARTMQEDVNYLLNRLKAE